MSEVVGHAIHTLFKIHSGDVGTFAAIVARAETHDDDDSDDSALGGDVKIAHAIVASATSSGTSLAAALNPAAGVAG